MTFQGAPLPSLLLLPHSDPANRRSTRDARRNGREYELRRRYPLPHMSSLRDSRRAVALRSAPEGCARPEISTLTRFAQAGARRRLAVIQSPALTRGRGRTNSITVRLSDGNHRFPLRIPQGKHTHCSALALDA